MQKVDLVKLDKAYYTAKAKPELQDIGPAQFLAVTGKGDPSGEGYAEKIQALYATAYTLKFISKKQGCDFAVAKLEGLWYFDTEKYEDLAMAEAPVKVPREEWRYCMMIRMPEFVHQGLVAEAITQVVWRKLIDIARDLELYTRREGKVVQMLHVGPFDAEPESLCQMESFMRADHLERDGVHHEIYLSDIRKTPPEKLKTILREPVRLISHPVRCDTEGPVPVQSIAQGQSTLRK